MKARAHLAVVRRFALLVASASALLLIPATPVFAEVIVDLNGSGSGSVVSSPAGINCANAGGGSPGPSCSASFAFGEPSAELTATPSSNSFFSGWVGDDPFGLGTCDSGSANPCGVVDLGEFALPPTTVTATFELLPDAPIATTGEATPGANDDLLTLEGTVNPNEFKVSECRFEYGTSLKYGASVPCTPADLGEGSADVPVSAEVEFEQLTPNTSYHYRLMASNIGGKSEGSDRTFITGSAPANNCEDNLEVRNAQQFGIIMLPNCMALELVSPPKKGGQPARFPAISRDGSRVKFESPAALADTPGVFSVAGDPYVASRESPASGWVTESTSPPDGDFRAGWEVFGAARSFSPDFSQWFHLGATFSQFMAGIDRAYQAGLDGTYSPLSPILIPRVVSNSSRFVVERSEFVGASSDHSHLYFTPGPPDGSAAYLPGDPELSGVGISKNTYIAKIGSAGEPSVELLARDRLGKIWGEKCGAHLGGTEAALSSKNGKRNQGAVSSAGDRVYMSARVSQPAGVACSNANKLRILVRLETSQGAHIEELAGSECARISPVCSSVNGDDLYQGASADGTKIYFTTNRQLTNSDLDGSATECSRTVAVAGCDLYLYDSTLSPGQRLIQVSRGGTGAPTPGEGAMVYNGVTAISGDGSHIYFVAKGILTTSPNPEGKSANEYAASVAKFYVWDRGSEVTSFIGALDSGDGAPGNNNGLWGSNAGTFRNAAYPVPVLGLDPEGIEVGGDGHILFFGSNASLTSNDMDGNRRDVFRYDSEGAGLQCVSCLSGADSEPLDVAEEFDPLPLGTDFAEIGRRSSEDGMTTVFTTAVGLVPGDVNGVLDGYLWRDGELFRLPGTSGGLLNRPVISGDGSEIAFQSFDQLLPEDGDSNEDIYIVRAGGGFPQPITKESCQPDESIPGLPCRQAPPSSPGETGNGSALVGPGNEFEPSPNCNRPMLKAKALRARARQARHQSTKAGDTRKAKQLLRKAERLEGKAKALSEVAKRCRRTVEGLGG